MADSCKRAAVALIGVILLALTACPVLAQKTSIYSLAELVDSANRHLPLLLEKQALVESAVVRSPVAEESNGDLIGPPQLGAKTGAGGNEDTRGYDAI